MILCALVAAATLSASPASSLAPEPPHQVLQRVLGIPLRADELPDASASCAPADCPARVERELSRLVLLGDVVGAQENIWRAELDSAAAAQDGAAYAAAAAAIADAIRAVAALQPPARVSAAPGRRRVYADKSVRTLSHGMFDCLLGNLTALERVARYGSIQAKTSALLTPAPGFD